MDALIATCDICGKEFNPTCGCGKMLAVIGEGHLSMSHGVFEAKLRAARLAGLREAVAMLETWAVEWGVVGDGYVDILSENFGKVLAARISHLEKGGE